MSEIKTYIYPCRECVNDKLTELPGYSLAECNKCGYPNDVPSEADEINYQEQLRDLRTGTN